MNILGSCQNLFAQIIANKLEFKMLVYNNK
jgi:hypothetical protein